MQRLRRYSISLAIGSSMALGGCGQDQAPGPPTPVATEAPSSVAASPRVAPPARGATRPRTVYVPAYSYLRTSRPKPTLYSITLSVRNVDPTASVTLIQVDYFDTSGHRVRSYLSTPKTLAPLETADFFVESNDGAGGSGANFLVYWEGPSDAHALLTEAVMIGFMGPGYSTFSSRGVELPSRPKLLEAETPSSNASASAPRSDGTSPSPSGSASAGPLSDGD